MYGGWTQAAPVPLKGDEEKLKAELRELTEKTRKVHAELRGMAVTIRTKDPTRAMIHTGPWTNQHRAVTAPAETAADHRRPVSNKRSTRQPRRPGK
jgi:hypothetical protein